MSKLVAKFNQTNIKINNRSCCGKGIVLSFTVANMIPGDQYRCTLTNIGSGEAVFKPNNFFITGIQQSEDFVVAMETTGSRVNTIKISVYNTSNPSEKAEDICSIECGDPQYLSLTFTDPNQSIVCGNEPNNIVAELRNLIPGNRYEYSFEPFNLSDNVFLTFLPTSGNITAGDANTNINSIVKYNGNNKSVIIKLTVTDAYNDYSQTILGTLKCN
jgi:hypothetical protein